MVLFWWCYEQIYEKVTYRCVECALLFIFPLETWSHNVVLADLELIT